MKRLLVILASLLFAGCGLAQCRMDGVDCGPLPSQATHSGKYLYTDGLTASWQAVVAGGLSGGTAGRLGIWTAADAMSSHPGLLADSSTGALTIGAQSDIVPVTLRAYSSGTSHIAQWQTSGNQPRGEITHDGALKTYSTASTGVSDYERASLSVTAGSGVVLAAETAGTGADNLDVTISPAGTGKVKVGATGVMIGSLYRNYYGGTPAWGLFWEYSGVLRFGLKQGAPRLGANTALAWESGSDVTLVGSEDLLLARRAAGVLAQRNGVNGQTTEIYGTYTDASNYVRASLSATSTSVTLAAETAGTGGDDVDVVVTPAGAGLAKVTRLRVVDSGTKPTCESATRGVIWMEEGGAGVADTLEVCKKDSGDAYAWSALF